jgi:hydroxyethylthiazole kinase-like uncharacterized protein yjeF
VPDVGDGWFGEASCQAIADMLPAFSAAVYGPGTGPWPEPGCVLETLAGAAVPLVVDADGLRRLAERPACICGRAEQTVLTPHPGEMRALLDGYGRAEALAADRLEQAGVLAAVSGATVVLKGLGTVIASPDGRLAVNTSGGPALATAGTGDVLAGILGALLAQGHDAWDAARTGVFLHGLAAECFPGAERALRADDLAELLPRAWLELTPAS